MIRFFLSLTALMATGASADTTAVDTTAPWSGNFTVLGSICVAGGGASGYIDVLGFGCGPTYGPYLHIVYYPTDAWTQAQDASLSCEDRAALGTNIISSGPATEHLGRRLSGGVFYVDSDDNELVVFAGMCCNGGTLTIDEFNVEMSNGLIDCKDALQHSTAGWQAGVALLSAGLFLALGYIGYTRWQQRKAAGGPPVGYAAMAHEAS